jgi:phosphopentomutase
MAELTPGNDSTTGHWELAGVVQERPFPTYPGGFPVPIVERFEAAIGRGVLGNVAASGTAIIAELGERHVATGRPILYTSADSVFQLAAHEEVVPLELLYAWCRVARDLMTGEHAVGRVIARPFTGRTGSFVRTANRRDLSLAPPGETLLDNLVASGLAVFGVGKIFDLFAGRGITEAVRTHSNREGMEATIDLMRRLREGLVFTNLIDFDTHFGHRNDPAGFAGALQEFDEGLEEMIGLCRPDDVLAITADHGNDPTTPGTDHSREYVPLLVYWPRGRRGVELGTRRSFADLGATLADYFAVRRPPGGRSFLAEIR